MPLRTVRGTDRNFDREYLSFGCYRIPASSCGEQDGHDGDNPNEPVQTLVADHALLPSSCPIQPARPAAMASDGLPTVRPGLCRQFGSWGGLFDRITMVSPSDTGSD